MTTKTNMFRVNTTNMFPYRGYRNVTFQWFVERRQSQLFGPGGVLNIAYSDAIKDWADIRNSDGESDFAYAELCLEEFFTADELAELVRYLASNGLLHDTDIRPVKLPIDNNMAGYGAVAFGGAVGCHELYRHEDYTLPFRVCGYFNLEGCDFDAAAPDARRAVEGFKVTADGKIEDWHVESRQAGKPAWAC
jgi:hypothetical protein